MAVTRANAALIVVAVLTLLATAFVAYQQQTVWPVIAAVLALLNLILVLV